MIEPDEIIYLDNNATTQLDPAVVEEMLPFLTSHYANPSSGYAFAAQVRDAIELARTRVAALIGCGASEIVFMSGGTEANNAALHSALQQDHVRSHVVTTAVEHSATRRYCQHLAERGHEVTFIGVDPDGKLDLDAVEAAIRPETAIVSIMWANNETGVICPIEKIAEIARRHRVFFHTDAIQLAGKLPIDVAAAPISFLSLSAHKIHGPKGVGALYVNRRAAFAPLLFGGTHENNRRAGTENVSGIVGFGKAAECALRHLEEEGRRVCKMRDRFEAELLAAIPGATVNGRRAERLPNTSSIAFASVDAAAALLMLDHHGICCSAGSACRTGSPETSHVLRAMQLTDEQARGSIRFSFGRFNSEAEIASATATIIKVVDRLQQMTALSA